MGMKAEEVPVEIFMRRRDLLDESHRVVELAEPGFTRRSGISIFETSTCRLQVCIRGGSKNIQFFTEKKNFFGKGAGRGKN